MSQIVLTNAHGTYSIDAMDLDRAIAHHLPASPAALKVRLTAHDRDSDWSDVLDVGEALIVLAWIEREERDAITRTISALLEPTFTTEPLHVFNCYRDVCGGDLYHGSERNHLSHYHGIPF